MVEVGRCQDLDGVERRVFEHRIEIGIEGRRPPICRGLSAHGLVGVADSGNFTAGIEEIPLDIHGRDVPCTEHTQSNLVHHASLSRCPVSHCIDAVAPLDVEGGFAAVGTIGARTG
jgi:hypothetical protein